MGVICELSLHMSDKDEETGLHHVKDRYCPEPGPCFSFDCNGRQGPACDHFVKLPTGVKVCSRH